MSVLFRTYFKYFARNWILEDSFMQSVKTLNKYFSKTYREKRTEKREWMQQFSLSSKFINHKKLLQRSAWYVLRQWNVLEVLFAQGHKGSFSSLQRKSENNTKKITVVWSFQFFEKIFTFVVLQRTVKKYQTVKYSFRRLVFY